MSNSSMHILVIRLSAMGDVAMTVPVLKALTRTHPDIKITLVSKAFLEPIFQQIPNVHFYAADVKGKHKGIYGLYKLYRELKRLKVDAVADLHNVLRSKILGTFFSFSSINVSKIDKGRVDKKALTKLNGKEITQLKTTHQRYVDVFQKLGFLFDLDEKDVLPQMEMTPKIISFIGKDTKKWIGIAPFAAFKGKTYPQELMEELIAKLSVLKDCKIILFGGASEKKLLNSWAEKYKNTVNCAGILSFEEELNLISNLDIMISMDSGNAHLAAMFGKKVITIWGITHPYAGFYPFAQPISNALLADRTKYPLIPTSVYGNSFPKGYEKVMHSIAPKSIYDKVIDSLKTP